MFSMRLRMDAVSVVSPGRAADAGGGFGASWGRSGCRAFVWTDVSPSFSSTLSWFLLSSGLCCGPITAASTCLKFSWWVSDTGTNTCDAAAEPSEPAPGAAHSTDSRLETANGKANSTRASAPQPRVSQRMQANLHPPTHITHLSSWRGKTKKCRAFFEKQSL